LVADIFEFRFKSAIRNDQAIKEGFELNETHHILICVDNIDFFVENVNISSFILQFAVHIYTGCPRRNVPDFGMVFLMLKCTDITQNTYVQS
jgi:hypothetical protein